jgi:hypothetical protein
LSLDYNWIDGNSFLTLRDLDNAVNYPVHGALRSTTERRGGMVDGEKRNIVDND